MVFSKVAVMAPDVTKASGNNVESSETDKKVQTAWKQPKHGTSATTEGEHQC